MGTPHGDDRLSQIATRWTLLVEAHADRADANLAALSALVERYQPAVYRYLLGAVRDPDVADELFQDFALRLVRGDFRNAQSGRGRFRDFLKTALINLIINHHKKAARQGAQALPFPEDVAGPQETADLDEEFLSNWRKTLLDRAWEALQARQKPDGPPYYLALRLRTEHPEWTAEQLAAHLTDQLRPAEPFTEAGLRKTLQRSREMFTDLVVEEVARSLDNPSPEELEQEVIDLGFQSYCRKALQRRNDKA